MQQNHSHQYIWDKTVKKFFKSPKVLKLLQVSQSSIFMKHMKQKEAETGLHVWEFWQWSDYLCLKHEH